VSTNPPTAVPEPTATPEPVPTATPAPTPTPEPFAVNRTVGLHGAETSLVATASGGLPATTYDQFVPLIGGTVHRVSWEGGYTFCDVQDTEAVPHATAFEIGIHNDNGSDAPDLGGPAFFVTVPIEEPNQTKIEDIVNQPCRDSSPTTALGEVLFRGRTIAT